MAEAVGFEPTSPLRDYLISSQGRYDHFDTLPNKYIYKKPVYYIKAFFKCQCLAGYIHVGQQTVSGLYRMFVLFLPLPCYDSFPSYTSFIYPILYVMPVSFS